MERVSTQQLAMMPIEFKLNGKTVIGRPDETIIETARQNIKISEMNLELSANQIKPSLGLTASYALAGVGGPLFERSGLGGSAVLVQDGGYFDAVRSIVKNETPPGTSR